MKQRTVWSFFFLSFIVLSTVSIVVYMNANECSLPEVPTISSSLFQEYVQGITIVLFVCAAFAFKSGREKLFIVALIIFAIAFFRNDNGVHITAIICATGLLWLALGYLFWKEHDRNKSTWVFIGMLTISVLSGAAFFILYFTTWETFKVVEKSTLAGQPDVAVMRKNPCSWIGWTEYVAFSLLFASTYVLVPDEEMYLFEDSRSKRRSMMEDQQDLL